ncbi:MAG: nucleotidyltransferase family protein, partial [Pseudomonadota bacterium]
MLDVNHIVRVLSRISKIDLMPSDIAFLLDYLQTDMSWEPFLAVAEAEGVDGLLYYHLKNLDLFKVPPEPVIRQLEDKYRHTTRHIFATISALKSISVRAAQAGIPVLALQGITLIKLYRDPGIRPLIDADLMIRTCHKKKFRDLLLDEGYSVPHLVYPDLFFKKGVWIDIHTHILNLDRIRNRQYLFPKDLELMWERATPFFGNEKGLLRLDPLDNFVCLAAHALKHSYSRLIWLTDLHEALNALTRTSGGWEEVIERTGLWLQEKTVLYALLILEGVFFQEVPYWVKEKLEIQRMGTIEKYLIGLKLKGFSSDRYCNALWTFSIRGVLPRVRFLIETL